MPLDVEQIADAVALMVATAIAPVLERLAVLETKATRAIDTTDLAMLRADLDLRLADLAQQKIPGPPGPPGPAGADGKDGLNGKDGAPGLRYLGVYVDGKEYEPGDVVTWRGSAWHCDGLTAAAPDTGRPWQLVVKAGRDGRDRRVEAAH